MRYFYFFFWVQDKEMIHKLQQELTAFFEKG